jgi:hypothetical protein
MIDPAQLADFCYTMSTSALRVGHTQDYGVSRGDFAGKIEHYNGDE